MDYQKLIDSVKARWPDRTIRFYRQKDALTGKEGDLEWQIGRDGSQIMFAIYDSSEHWEINGFVKGWLAAVTASLPDTAQPPQAES